MSDLIKGTGHRLQVAGAPLNDHFRQQPAQTAFIHGGKLFVISGEFLATFDVRSFPGMEASANGNGQGAEISIEENETVKLLIASVESLEEGFDAHETVIKSREFKQIMELAETKPASGG